MESSRRDRQILRPPFPIPPRRPPLRRIDPDPRLALLATEGGLARCAHRLRPRAPYVEGQDRSQVTLSPESLDEYIAEDNPVRVVDVFVKESLISPSTLLKIYIYGYLNRIQSSTT